MVALPDVEPGSFPSARSGAARWPQARDGIARIVLRIAGAGLVVAAPGLWLLPAPPGDPVMLLLRLLVSLGLLGSGALCLGFAARGAAARPSMRIAPDTRVLHVPRRDPDGAWQMVAHRLDDLHEVSLRDGLLSARDRRGRVVLSVDVPGPREERALRAALSRAL
jgi:hypothetical protein